MEERFLTELFLECYTIQELISLYRRKRTKSNIEEERTFYDGIRIEMSSLANQKYDELLIEMEKENGRLSNKVIDQNELIQDAFPFHINVRKESIRAMKTFETKAVFRDI